MTDVFNSPRELPTNIARCMSVWYDGSGSVGYHCFRPAGHRGPCGEGTTTPVAQPEQPTCALCSGEMRHDRSGWFCLAGHPPREVSDTPQPEQPYTDEQAEEYAASIKAMEADRDQPEQPNFDHMDWADCAGCGQTYVRSERYPTKCNECAQPQQPTCECKPNMSGYVDTHDVACRVRSHRERRAERYGVERNNVEVETLHGVNPDSVHGLTTNLAANLAEDNARMSDALRRIASLPMRDRTPDARRYDRQAAIDIAREALGE
jgi:hypothetical protein